MTYCAKDTAATQEVFAALWPKYLDRFPHPVSFAGMLEMGSAYLPVDRSWENYIRDADDTYEDLEKEMKCSLMKLADDTCNYLHGKRFPTFFLSNFPNSYCSYKYSISSNNSRPLINRLPRIIAPFDRNI